MTDTPKLNLRQKLVEVYKRIDHIEKEGYNEKQRYGFVKAAAVLRALRDAFADLGIYAEPNYELLGTYDIKTNSGGVMHTATVKATIVLFDADSDETKTISGLGDGADGGDKGIYKAQTGATKNALRNGALLPDSADSDPEADTSVDQQTSQNDVTDFQEARHAAPRPNTPQNAQKRSTDRPTAPVAPQATQNATAAHPTNQPVPSTETHKSSGADAAVAPSSTGNAPDAVPEHTCIDGDHQKCTDAALAAQGPMPTEEELTVYRKDFKNLGDDLSLAGKLKASRGLPINRKLLTFLLSITGASDAKNISKSQWDDFFSRVNRVKGLDGGMIGLAKRVNEANGIEEKK